MNGVLNKSLTFSLSSQPFTDWLSDMFKVYIIELARRRWRDQSVCTIPQVSLSLHRLHFLTCHKLIAHSIWLIAKTFAILLLKRISVNSCWVSNLWNYCSLYCLLSILSCLRSFFVTFICIPAGPLTWIYCSTLICPLLEPEQFFSV